MDGDAIRSDQSTNQRYNSINRSISHLLGDEDPSVTPATVDPSSAPPPIEHMDSEPPLKAAVLEAREAALSALLCWREADPAKYLPKAICERLGTGWACSTNNEHHRASCNTLGWACIKKDRIEHDVLARHGIRAFA